MILRRAKSAVGVLVLGFALAATPVAINQAAAAKHHPKHKATSHASSGVSVAGCSAVSHEQSQETSLESGLASAFESGNFATIKTAILNEFTLLTGDISKAESYLSGAPANVRAAFATVAKAYTNLKTQIQASTTLPQLEAAFTSLGQNSQLEAAGMVLANYFDARCGITPPTT